MKTPHWTRKPARKKGELPIAGLSFLSKSPSEFFDPAPNLFSAIANGHADITPFIDQGDHFRLRQTGNTTPLMAAAQAGNIDALVALLSAGCRVDTIDNQRRTALFHCAPLNAWDVFFNPRDRAQHIALRAGRLECMKALCSAGADPAHVDRSGRTVAMIAASECLAECMLFLAKLGADFAFSIDDLDAALRTNFSRKPTQLREQALATLEGIAIAASCSHPDGASAPRPRPRI